MFLLLGQYNPLQAVQFYYATTVIRGSIYQCSSCGYGAGGLKRVPAETINTYSIAVPEIEEQTQIANFLDYETAQIDTLIEKQQTLIKLLKEKRQTVISHAVTKGLNSSVPIKDSDVEWLGKVPEHWAVKIYRHASEIYRGKFGHRPRNDPAFYDGGLTPAVKSV